MDVTGTTAGFTGGENTVDDVHILHEHCLATLAACTGLNESCDGTTPLTISGSTFAAESLCTGDAALPVAVPTFAYTNDIAVEQ